MFAVFAVFFPLVLPLSSCLDTAPFCRVALCFAAVAMGKCGGAHEGAERLLVFWCYESLRKKHQEQKTGKALFYPKLPGKEWFSCFFPGVFSMRVMTFTQGFQRVPCCSWRFLRASKKHGTFVTPGPLTFPCRRSLASSRCPMTQPGLLCQPLITSAQNKNAYQRKHSIDQP